MRGGGARATERRRLESLRAPDDLQADDLLDAWGLFCPVPILRTAERMGKLLPGQVLEVLSDDRVILIDLPAWCLSTGHEYLGFREGQGEWRLFVRKG